MVKGKAISRIRLENENCVSYSKKHQVTEVKSMSQNVFVYGSLMFPEIYRKVTGSVPELTDAKLPGFRRYAVEGRGYPAIAPESEGNVEGKLLINVSDDELQALDSYEGISSGLYSRCRVQVEGPNGQVEAETYVAGYALEKRLKGEWDPAEFEKSYLGKPSARIAADFRAIEDNKLNENQS